ncbi:serine threonine- kinase 31 isoform X1 [Pelobates cultripes]|uniref:Serine threonine- kinase 31 isoform X1 n=1 Tax=Pelobates cultripes TaxID=61616 RepID=A0AAD1RW30_PELCU|nr:serine threonine- kinase 31 isoform X1 [Pelobates cultripes]
MEGEPVFNKVENVYVSHVEDAVTFWAQPLSRIHDISKLSESLAKVCQSMNTVFGIPDLDKIYAGLFSADKCWYRCKLQYVVNDEQCSVTYVDYGNSEILNRSSIVELPEDLQFSPVAQKYRLWGLQLKTRTDIEQVWTNRTLPGLKLLTTLIADKQISVQQKATYKDGTVIVQVIHGNLDIGEEMAKKGFAEKCKIVSSPNKVEDIADEQQSNAKQQAPWKFKKLERLPMREPKSFPMFNPCSNDHRFNLPFTEMHCRNQRQYHEVNAVPGCSPDINCNTADLKVWVVNALELFLGEHDWLLCRLEAMMRELNGLQSGKHPKEKETSKETIGNLQETLQLAVGNKLKKLTIKIEALRAVRCTNENTKIGDDLLEAISIVTEERISTPSSLNQLEETWTEYSFSQEKIRSCSDVSRVTLKFSKLDMLQQTLHSSVELFILEVDELPLEGRQTKLKALLLSLSAVYGTHAESEGLDSVFDTFFKWKQAKMEQFNCVRNDTNNSLGSLSSWFYDIKEVSDLKGTCIFASKSLLLFLFHKFFDLTADTSLSASDVVGNIDDILNKVESDISKELEISLMEQNEEDKKIIRNAYNRVVELIHQELALISVIQSKYSYSVEFKKNIVEWLDKSPNVDHLMSVKKNIKRLKAQLRWKIVERSTLEEADEYSETILAEISHDIAVLRNNIFSEISQEQEEYGTLSILVQKWFPELPLIHPEAGILRYMKSGGLLSDSMERDLLDGEPMKELSSKRPLVKSEIKNKQVLLKGYSVGVDTEEKVIERASKYRAAWCKQKEESGIMELLNLFFCKADPLLYLMVPFYPGESLGSVQANTSLDSNEIVRVMRGVAQGLQTLHAANIIIGSLHENNVFVVNRQKGIVGDFDFTKDAEQRSSVTWSCFPHLIAPELKLGVPASESSDLYAYGCILLWLSIRKRDFAVKTDGTPDLNGLDLDMKLKDLLSNLLSKEERMRAEQVKTHEYLQLPEETVNILPDTESGIAKNTPADFA